MNAQIEDESNATVLVKLRMRMNDLLRLGITTPEGFGLYQQTMLQLYHQFERRKQSCFTQAEQLRTQAAAVESQGHAFAACGSIMYSIVHGYIELEEKRIREELERKERDTPLEEAGEESSPEEALLQVEGAAMAPPKKKMGRPKKVLEPAVVPTPSPGAVTDAPDES